MLMIDARYGNFLQMPFNCDLLEMPKKTIDVYFILQGLYREKISEDERKAFKKN